MHGYSKSSARKYNVSTLTLFSSEFFPAFLAFFWSREAFSVLFLISALDFLYSEKIITKLQVYPTLYFK